jgi:hypothetical protein
MPIAQPKAALWGVKDAASPDKAPKKGATKSPIEQTAPKLIWL